MAAGEGSFALTGDIATTDVTDVHNLDRKPGLDIHVEKDTSGKVDVHLSRKHNYEGMVQLNAVMDNLQPQLDSQYL